MESSSFSILLIIINVLVVLGILTNFQCVVSICIMKMHDRLLEIVDIFRIAKILTLTRLRFKI